MESHLERRGEGSGKQALSAQHYLSVTEVDVGSNNPMIQWLAGPEVIPERSFR